MPSARSVPSRWAGLIARTLGAPVRRSAAWSCLALLVGGGSQAWGAPILVPVNATTFETEHCLFIVDATVQWNSPAAAYNDIYGAPFARLSACFTTLTTLFPGNYFSVCYLANTGDAHVPNYIDRTYKAAGISTGPGSSGIGNGDPNAAQSFGTVDFCRYNLNNAPYGGVLAVFDHELGHAWGAQFFNNVSGVGPGILSNGHWLSNTTIDCQMSTVYSDDGGATINKLYGDPASGFHYQRVDNLRSNDVETLSEQALYLLGAAEQFPTTYALDAPVYHTDLTVTSASVETYDQAAVLARYGPRNPDYRSAPKRFRIGFVYVARDAAEVNAVYAAVEQAVDQFCNGETLDPAHFRFQTPFLVDTHFRASVDGRLADLDGTSTPTLDLVTPYVSSSDGSATIPFTATDAAGSPLVVTVLPASTQCSVGGAAVQAAGLPDGVHFFTLKAANSAGKRAFAHFVVEVHRPVTATAIAASPITQTVVAGATATFSVEAGGAGPLTYQWFRQAARTSTWNALGDGGAYSGTTSAALTIASSTDFNGDQFLCMVANAAGQATSAAAALMVNETPPSLSGQPADTAVPTAGVAHFSVAAAGAPLTFGYFNYQWQKRANGAGTWTDVTDSAGAFVGATTPALSVYGTVVAMTGDTYRCLITNTAGTTPSAAGTLTVNQPPAVTTQPINASASPGDTVSFSVVATGTAPLSYQWQKYAAVIPGATSATFTIADVQPSDSGSYGVKVTNAAGFTYSNFASLAVAATSPAFTTQPQSQGVAAGADATFTAAASGSSPLAYQWARNGSPIPGATAAHYTITHAQASDAGNYTVTVSNTAGSAISGAAVLTVSAAAPSITTPPQSVSVPAGASATFTVVANGTAPFSYQWFKNGTSIPGAMEASYVLESTTTNDAADYSVTVTNNVGPATSAAATLTIVAVAIAPSITTPPVDAAVDLGASVSFSVLAAGTAPLTYQWYHDGAVIGGATSPTYTLATVQLSDAGAYMVMVANAAGFATSSAATLAIQLLPPAISIQPGPVSAAAGDPVTFTVAATGTPPFAYQWFKDGVALSGATAPSYSLPTCVVGDAGSYSVIITSAVGSTSSRAAVLTVAAPASLPTSVLINLSVRTTLAPGQKLIPGFVTNGPKPLLLRAAGPALTALGLGLNGYPDPDLQVYDQHSAFVTENDNWNPVLAPTFAQLGAFSFAVGSKDAALTTAVNGVSSAFVAGNGSGTVLMELYDTQVDYANRLVNLSARNQVGTGADVLIVGFVIAGTGPKQLLIRGVGPTLAHYGITAPLADPYLELFSSTAQKLAENDDWDASLSPLFTRLGAFPLDGASKDAALLISLPPGVYSAKLSGVGNTTGEGLLEVYEVWP